MMMMIMIIMIMLIMTLQVMGYPTGETLAYFETLPHAALLSVHHHHRHHHIMIIIIIIIIITAHQSMKRYPPLDLYNEPGLSPIGSTGVDFLLGLLQ